MNYTSIVKNSINSESKMEYESIDSYSIDKIDYAKKSQYISPLKNLLVESERDQEKFISGIIANGVSTQVINRIPFGKTHRFKESSTPIFPVIMFRYVRDHCNGGSNVNEGNHWVGIEIINKVTGEKISENKPITSPMSFLKMENIVNGKFEIAYYGSTSEKNAYVEIDLQQTYLLSDCTLRVANYPDRIYKETYTEVSEDGINWIIVRDTKVTGTYLEDGIGKVINLSNDVGQFNKNIFFNESLEQTYQKKQNSEISNIGKMYSEALRIENIESHSIIKKTFKETKSFKPVTVDVCKDIENIALYSVRTNVKNQEVKEVKTEESFPNIMINIKSDIPLEIGKTANGEGLKNINLELQPLSYIKVSLDFGLKSVQRAKGLPPGMQIKNGYIEGSPTVSGVYNLVIILNDGSIVNGKIKVNILDRII